MHSAQLYPPSGQGCELSLASDLHAGYFKKNFFLLLMPFCKLGQSLTHHRPNVRSRYHLEGDEVVTTEQPRIINEIIL